MYLTRPYLSPDLFSPPSDRSHLCELALQVSLVPLLSHHLSRAGTETALVSALLQSLCLLSEWNELLLTDLFNSDSNLIEALFRVPKDVLPAVLGKEGLDLLSALTRALTAPTTKADFIGVRDHNETFHPSTVSSPPW